MCGIAGYAGWRRSEGASNATLSRMCGAIRHRGPDDEGHFVADRVALGMRRLSVIDVAGGHQPMSNERDTVHVVFNGEIYNHHVIRSRLEGRHTFHTRSDTEVLVHLYEERGAAMVDELRGMFAFAIWDAEASRLLVARDRMGIKPLYYFEHGDGIAFGSELKALQVLPEFPREVDPRAMTEYLALGYVPDPLCIFKGVHKLPPGHTLEWDAVNGAVVRQYWTASRAERPVTDEREAIEELRRLIADAVESHLESDVRLGAFLSGGIDSSTVVAQMARTASRQVETFSIGFAEEEFNEAPHAARVAAALGTKHTELIVRPEADALVEDLVDTFDEPFGDSSALPTMLVSRLAREHVTVALSGDGGDELFGGYTRYAAVADGGDTLPALARSIIHAGASRLPHQTYGRNVFLNLSRGMRGRYAATVAQALPLNEGGVMREVAREHSMDHLLDRWFDTATDRDFLTQMTLVDIGSYLPGDILTKVDRASMHVSLEARVPLLDHPLVEFAVSLPGSLKRRNGQGKWILREAIKGLVPDSVLTQPKRGFAVPLVRWLRNELRHRLERLMAPDRALYAYVDREGVARLVREHISGRRDHSHFLWRLLVLDLWLTSLAASPAQRPALT
ncbi:MAG: asparagine synthase (glutamine-hydrolyzing) [Gemmatimonadaceae bacterium]